MERRSRSSSSNDEEPPTKTRRSPRACLQCRARKQKCILWADRENEQSPCQRCKQLNVTCSFTVEPPQPNVDFRSPSGLAELVTELRTRSVLQEERIAALEWKIDQSNTNETEAAIDIQPEQHPSPVAPHNDSGVIYPSPGVSFDQLDIAPPIATLRSLGAVGQTAIGPNNGDKRGSAYVSDSRVEFDPVTRSILTEAEAVRAVQIFFDNCHSHAPVLDIGLRSSPLSLRHSRPRLLLSLCLIGARYWTEEQTTVASYRSLHPRYPDLAEMLDKALARLLLKPDTADVNLESLQILLLYAQWMSCGPDCGATAAGSTTRFRNRYNDLSAWAVLGLAARYAKLLNIEQDISRAFGKESLHTEYDGNDISRLRAYNNLLTCDFNLMLSSGLPASIDPAPAINANSVFEKSRQTQYPEDARIAALVRLVDLTHRATEHTHETSSRKLDTRSLRKLNLDLEDWEGFHLKCLHHTPSQHNRMPFTSARWYRLALNSACLGPLLSSTAERSSQRIPSSLLEPLDISLTAAVQILLTITSWGEKHVYRVKSQDPSSLPSDTLIADKEACDHLQFAVDSTWISHTFALSFLLLCFVRGVIDDDLSIQHTRPSSADTTSGASRPRPDSLLTRLLHLGNEMFARVCQGTSSHPAHAFGRVVGEAVSLLLPSNDGSAEDTQNLDQSTIQAFSDLLDEIDVYWPGNLFDLENAQVG